MPAKPISIGSLHFERKGDAVAHFKAMLNRYDVGDKVSAADGHEVHSLLALHPDAGEKMAAV